MLGFCVRYRRGSSASRADPTQEELGNWRSAGPRRPWSPFSGSSSGAREIYIWLYQSPPGDLEIFVVGKQWMWKIEHPGGQREIDALHVPVGKTVRLVLASQDVIHSFFIPAFRIKHDVVPGHLRDGMVQGDQDRRIPHRMFRALRHRARPDDRPTSVVMEPAAYAHWLTDQGVRAVIGPARRGAVPRNTAAAAATAPTARCTRRRSMASTASFVHLQNGSVVRADERYIRDCILEPRSFTVAGYPPIMPSFSGQIGEGDLIEARRLHPIPRQIGQSLANRTARWPRSPPISRPII